jgi:hypothetical protein
MTTFDRDRYKDHSEALNLIRQQVNQFSNLMIKAGIDYMGKISGKIDNKEFHRLRQSATLRLQSILFHYDLLASINISGQEKISDIYPSPIDGMRKSLKQDFLFDSIIFHSISFYDYLSCFISYIAFGDKKAQWSAISNKARTKKEFKNSELAKVIDEADRFVTKLVQYRGELIHYKDDSSSFSQSFDVKNCIIKTYISAPTNFKNSFKKEFKNFSGKELDINSICLWIIDIISSDSIKIIGELRNYIEQNRIVPIGKEVIFMKNRTK